MARHIPGNGNAVPAKCRNGESESVSFARPDCSQDNLETPFVQAGDAARDALLHCLRQHVRDARLYEIELETIGVALSSGIIGTGEAMHLLADLDGVACLDAIERRAAA